MQPLEENCFPRDVWISILSSSRKEKLYVFLIVSKYMKQLFYDSILNFSVENDYDWKLWQRDKSIIEKCINIRCLELKEGMGIKDDTIRHLRGLKMLYINPHSREETPSSNCITDKGISDLTNLCILDVGEMQIGDNGVSRLTSLTELYMRDNDKITDNGIRNMTNLKHLMCNNLVTDESICHLVKLRDLILCGNSAISDKSISRLTNLTVLCIPSWADNITDNSVSFLTNLTSLTAITNQLTGECIERLTNLRSLCCRRPIGYSHLAKLTNLTELTYWNPTNTHEVDANVSLMNLTKMKKLTLGGNPVIIGGTIKCMPNLTYLSLDGKTDIIKNKKRTILPNGKKGGGLLPIDYVIIDQHTIQSFYI